MQHLLQEIQNYKNTINTKTVNFKFFLYLFIYLLFIYLYSLELSTIFDLQPATCNLQPANYTLRFECDIDQSANIWI